VYSKKDIQIYQLDGREDKVPLIKSCSLMIVASVSMLVALRKTVP